RGVKGTLWEGGHRVPGIAYWPGMIHPQSVTDVTAMTMDLLPTIATIAGLPLPSGLKPDGANLLPVLRDGKSLPQRTLFWRFGRDRAVREGPWKLLITASRRGKRKTNEATAADEEICLFNLETDLGEKKNLADAQPDRVRAMQVKLTAWEKDVSAGVTRRA
ncbi:MAG: sulfatase-like hydrolase/transferase, partial [Phycisphaerae bacterium]|nr:sulfatase-like hydrolase/transferase [Phycisphaerae bacterium]